MNSFDDILGQLRAVAEGTRLRVLRLLAEGDLTVTELADLLGQSQPRVSRHLKVLADVGLIEGHQEGAWTFYRLKDGPLLAALGLRGGGKTAVDIELLPEDARALQLLRDERAAAAAAYFATKAADWERLRSLHIDDATIEARLLNLAGDDIQTFLDVGTGTGRMLVVFRDRFERGVGVDTSPEMLTVARANLAEANVTHAQVRRADVIDDPLPDDVDLVCFHHVLHFMAEPERALMILSRQLSATGQILIADFASHDREDLRETYAHRRLGFADEEIARWARRSNLTVTASEEFAPPVEGGLTSRIWRLSRQPADDKRTTSKSRERTHAHA